jgi:Transposase DDE domain group 1
MFKAQSYQYEFAERVRGCAVGGIGAIHWMVRSLGLDREIDRSLRLLKFHVPYHESDHVLNIAYNVLCGGTCLEDLERLRNDETYVRTLGADRIPDPTTAGDFCRRLDGVDLTMLMNAINRVRAKVWARQPRSFFREAVIEADGSSVPTQGECKAGMDINYKGEWGYHPLVVSLANTAEPLFVANRPGNRPSHEGAAAYFDRAIELCRSAGFRSITLRGDTDFSQTEHLDRWDEEEVKFLFGYDAAQILVERAEKLPDFAWQRLDRAPKYEVRTHERARPRHVKERIVESRAFENIKLVSESVAQFHYCPTRCKKSYRIVVVRKDLKVLKGQELLYPDVRYFFYLTNDFETAAEELVFEANDRCDQENLLRQLKSGTRSLRAPLDNLDSNAAYMVIASLAWTLKAWAAFVTSGKRAVAQASSRSEANSLEDGLPELRRGVYSHSGPACAFWPASNPQASRLEPIATDLPPLPGCPRTTDSVLT